MMQADFTERRQDPCTSKWRAASQWDAAKAYALLHLVGLRPRTRLPKEKEGDFLSANNVTSN